MNVTLPLFLYFPGESRGKKGGDKRRKKGKEIDYNKGREYVLFSIISSPRRKGKLGEGKKKGEEKGVERKANRQYFTEFKARQGGKKEKKRRGKNRKGGGRGGEPLAAPAARNFMRPPPQIPVCGRGRWGREKSKEKRRRNGDAQRSSDFLSLPSNFRHVRLGGKKGEVEEKKGGGGEKRKEGSLSLTANAFTSKGKKEKEKKVIRKRGGSRISWKIQLFFQTQLYSWEEGKKKGGPEKEKKKRGLNSKTSLSAAADVTRKKRRQKERKRKEGLGYDRAFPFDCKKEKGGKNASEKNKKEWALPSVFLLCRTSFFRDTATKRKGGGGGEVVGGEERVFFPRFFGGKKGKLRREEETFGNAVELFMIITGGGGGKGKGRKEERKKEGAA